MGTGFEITGVGAGGLGLFEAGVGTSIGGRGPVLLVLPPAGAAVKLCGVVNGLEEKGNKIGLVALGVDRGFNTGEPSLAFT